MRATTIFYVHKTENALWLNNNNKKKKILWNYNKVLETKSKKFE
jgi:hypothetical protein